MSFLLYDSIMFKDLNRFERYFLIIGGIFKSILWIAPMLKGDLSNTSVLVSCLLYLVCDAYGYLNWRKMEKIQDTLQNN